MAERRHHSTHCHLRFVRFRIDRAGCSLAAHLHRGGRDRLCLHVSPGYEGRGFGQIAGDAWRSVHCSFEVLGSPSIFRRMKDSAWRKRLLQSTRGKILGFLRSGERTVNDLAADLELTDNAVRAHLASLERDGLIHQVGTQAGFRKPHALYALTPDAEQFFPKSYGPLLSLVLDVIGKKLSVRDFRSAMRSVGKTVAGEHLDGLAGKA